MEVKLSTRSHLRQLILKPGPGQLMAQLIPLLCIQLAALTQDV